MTATPIHADLIARNAARWQAAKLTRAPEFTPVAARLVAAKARYQDIERATAVPWFIVAVIHEREASQDFSKSIAQGDPWDKVSTHEPRGRGPFASFEDAAYDALVNCAPYAAHWSDWSAGGGLTLLELYNGLVYANHGEPSPYVWSGTDQYLKGKVLVDHGPIEPVVDKQLGCAGLILAMQAIDVSIVFGAPPANAPRAKLTDPIKGGAAISSAAAAGAAASQAGFPLWQCALVAGLIALIVFAVWYWRQQKKT
jgi:lysozyme family protein